MANGIICLDKNKHKLAHFYAAILFHPVKSTILCAIKNKHFDSWPELTYLLISKYLETTLPMLQGHLDQEFKNLRSTQNQVGYEEDMAPMPDKNNIETKDIICLIVHVNDIKYHI